MKRNLPVTILLFFISLSASAQVIDKGDKLFGGSFSLILFNSNPSGPQSNYSSNAGILPSFEVAVKPNLALGVRGSINYAHNKSTNIAPQDYEQTGFGLGLTLFLKKYKLLQNKFGVYFDNAVSGSSYYQKQQSAAATQKDKLKGADYTFRPGVFYRFSDRFFGEANIGGASVSYTHGSNNNNFSIGASFLQTFNLGINYRISKKK